MLAVQVQYWSLKESERHNKATEAETSRHNKETESLGWASLDETIRHNMATEAYYNGQLNETVRHNLVQEDLGYINARINQQNADSNRISAQAAMSQAGAAWMNAETNARRAEYDYSLGLMAQDTAARNADVNEQRATNDWQLGWNNLDVQKEKNRLEASSQEIQRERLELDTTLGYWSNINNSVKVGGDLVMKGLSSSGAPMGTKGNDAFKALDAELSKQPNYYAQ